MPNGISRIVALGASNLTRSFGALVSLARAEWGPGIEIFAAMGHGRSYGIQSRVMFRTLPGILESGLWRVLDSLPMTPVRAVISDVGNDILYGLPAGRILDLLEETVHRLQRLTQDIVITGLPPATIRGLSNTKFLVFRSLLFPRSRLSYAEVIETAGRVDDGIAELSAARNLRLLRLDPAWYGIDPIHFRRSCCIRAWREILGARSSVDESSLSFKEKLTLLLIPPERRWLFGIEQFTSQNGRALPLGGRIWLY